MLNEIYQSLDPVAFSLGPLSVRWYGIAYVVGFICAALILYRVARRWKVRVDVDALLTVMVSVIVGVIVGARLGYVLFYGDGYYLSHPLEILAFNKGGMSFHGGLIGALLSGIVAARITKIPLFDVGRFGLHRRSRRLVLRPMRELRQRRAVGRANRCGVGRGVRGAAGMMPRHPSQLYEALLEGVVIFIVLYALSRRSRRA